MHVPTQEQRNFQTEDVMLNRTAEAQIGLTDMLSASTDAAHC